MKTQQIELKKQKAEQNMNTITARQDRPSARDEFVAGLVFGCIDSSELKQLVQLDRLCPVLVRCGGGRFFCPAQDVEHFVGIIGRDGTDYVRDVSVKSDICREAEEKVQQWKECKV